MLVTYRTEISPSEEQRIKINQTIGVCRYIYNFYLDFNNIKLKEEGKIIPYKKFSVWLNNEYLPNHPELSWIKEVSSKSVKKSLENANAAFTRYFKKLGEYPRFKKKGKNDPSMYFVKTDAKTIIHCERHRIKIPTLGWVKLKEKGYLPVSRKGILIRSGAVTKQAGRYYVTVVVDEPEERTEPCTREGIGIDLGIKDLAILSDGRVIKNINKSARVRKLEKQLRREQRSLSRKYENLKKEKKGKTAQRKNIDKQKLKVQKLHQRLTNIRTDHVNKAVKETVRTKPSYITMEDLNVRGMMKNRHLAKAVANQKFYELKTKLKWKCKKMGIELREVDRFYPSSKRCHRCGKIKKDLRLSMRRYECECGYKASRDLNAALNLRDVKTYIVAV